MEQQPVLKIANFKHEINFPQHLKIANQPPTLNKIVSSENTFYCGYSNGMILQYNYPIDEKNINNDYKNVYYPYQNLDVIDMDVFSQDYLLMCTHTEVTLLNLVKNRRSCLRGHQQTPIAISSHPISPLVVSVSNLIIQHDLRMLKPILVNYITPPVYSIQYFPDGQAYLLSGEPCRVGKDKWVRTLQNGIGKVSRNSKFLLTNDMNSSLTMWDWRQSQKVIQLRNIKNTQNYQNIHFLAKDQIDQGILFFQDDGNLLKHQILQNRTSKQKLFQVGQANWKTQISIESNKTKHLLAYEHQQARIRCYQLN